MLQNQQWMPKEIIVHQEVVDDPVTHHVLSQCSDVPVKYVLDGGLEAITQASEILRQADNTMLNKILAGKKVLYIAPAGNAVDVFTMPDDRMMCPHFDRLKLANNGCFYQCDWCYLKGTYRAAFPFITIRAQYDTIKKKIKKRLAKTAAPVMFNSGELADSLSMEHLTQAGREFISWFGRTGNGFLFMLTKSDNVDNILDLSHNGHTIVAWSMNEPTVSKKFELGAPPFERRLEAARKVQDSGYPIRIRLDPIVPFEGWQKAYAETIQKILGKVSPDRITVGTLRFEKQFYRIRKPIITTGQELLGYMDGMVPMFSPKAFPGTKSPKSGKYSFTEEKRVEIFDFVIQHIRKYSDCPVALCKESAVVWGRLGMDLGKCRCVCQLDFVDMVNLHSL